MNRSLVHAREFTTACGVHAREIAAAHGLLLSGRAAPCAVLTETLEHLRAAGGSEGERDPLPRMLSEPLPVLVPLPAPVAAEGLALLRGRRCPAVLPTNLWRLFGRRYAEELRAEWLDLAGTPRGTRIAFLFRITGHHPAARVADRRRRSRRPV
jgi:hypothetical protein